MSDPQVDIQKIEETIRNLQSLKEQGLLPADQADASIAALKNQLATYHAALNGDGAIAQGQNAKAVGKDGVLIDGDMTDSVFIKGDSNEVYVGSQPRARKESLRESYLTYMLELTSPLALSGVVRQSASEAETRLDLSAVYTALRTTSPTLISALALSKEIIKSLRDAGLETVEDVMNSLDPEEVSLTVFRDFGDKDFDKLREIMSSKGNALRAQTTTGASALWHANKKPRLVLLGDPGSGKSTFVNYLALCLVGELLGREDVNLNMLTQPLPVEDKEKTPQNQDENPERQPWIHGPLIPVRIILRDFAVRGLPGGGESSAAEHLWRFIEEELEGAALSEYVPLLKKELRDQGGLLLFDGLDEVPEAEQRREQIKQAIESFVSSFPRCRYIVTSRTYAYQNQDWKLKGFIEAVIAPYTNGQINQFVDRWYTHIARTRKQNEDDARGKAALLKRAIKSNARLMGLAERPLLLTLMASLHTWRGGTLPDKREELYADAVDLLLDWWENQRVVRDGKGNVLMIQPSLVEWLKVDRKKVRELLNQIAYEAHAGQTEIVGTADVPETALIAGLMNLSQNPDVKPARLIEYMRDRAGLLISRGVGVYTFPHRTFQEYLAACYLTDHDYPEAVARLAREEPNRWRETALLAGAKAARGTADFALWALVDMLSPEEESDQDNLRHWGALIAGQAITEIANLERVNNSVNSKMSRLRTRLLDIMEGNRLAARERSMAGNLLASLGDPRFNANSWNLPIGVMFGFIRIPAGKFLMGSELKNDSQAHHTEQPQHTVDIPYDYYVARYPVTVAQYKIFLEESGYKTTYETSMLGVPNHPAVNVTWYESLEYCRWLDKKLKNLISQTIKDAPDKGSLAFWQGLAENKLHVSLPSEAEWEKASRGVDGRTYPWGNKFDPSYANMDQTGIGTTSSVGCFPSGVCPYGMLDMSGNVWEWTRSIYGEWDKEKSKFQNIALYPYNSEDGREDLNKPANYSRVSRGGSFRYASGALRCARRSGGDLNLRYVGVGFRLAISPMLRS